jgi:hypothetical protein
MVTRPPLNVKEGPWFRGVAGGCGPLIPLIRTVARPKSVESRPPNQKERIKCASTNLIEPGKYETIYANMPLLGLAAAMSHVRAEGGLSAARDHMRGG